MYHPTTEEEYNQIKQANRDHLIIVKFSTEWCKPCREIAPKMEELAKKYPHVVFISVDIDELDDLPDAEHVKTPPTFMFYKDNEPIDGFVGANIDSVVRRIAKHT